MKKIILVFFISLFLMNFVIAQPPLQVNINTDEGFNIVFPKFDTIKINEDFDFRFHVFNISDGIAMDNETVSCYFHLYNKTGDSIYRKSELDVNPAHTHTWTLLIKGENFSYAGDYAYLVHCNSSDLGGFASASFSVTPTGTELTEAKSNLLVGSFIVLIVTTIFFMVLGLFAKNIPFKIFFISLSILFMVTTIGFSVSVWQQIFGTLGNLVETYGKIFILLTILLTGGGIGLFVYLIYMAIMSFWNNSRGMAKDLD